MLEFDKMTEKEKAEFNHRIFVVVIASSLLFLPLPTWIFDMCRVRYRLLNKLMSVMVEEELDIGPDLNQAQVI